MKIELNKIYMTKRNIPVKITMRTTWGYFGTLQDNSKRSVKYDENGKVPGWSRGNMLDIKGSDEDENVKSKKTTLEEYTEKYEAKKKETSDKETKKTPTR